MEYKACSNSVIYGGGEEYTIIKKGNIQITFGGRNHVFLNVYYVWGTKLNLLSMSQIMHHCPKLDVVFNAHKCYIVNRESKETIVVGLEDYGLFLLFDIGESQELSMVAKCSSISSLWHQRYGHLNLSYFS